MLKIRPMPENMQRLLALLHDVFSRRLFCVYEAREAFPRKPRIASDLRYLQDRGLIERTSEKYKLTTKGVKLLQSLE